LIAVVTDILTRPPPPHHSDGAYTHTSMGCAASASNAPIAAAAMISTLPDAQKLIAKGMSPEDIEKEAEHWKTIAGGRNFLAFDRETWSEVCEELESAAPFPVEKIKVSELPCVFALARDFGDEEKDALLALIEGWGIDKLPAVDLANALIRIATMPVMDVAVDGVTSPYATEIGRSVFGDPTAKRNVPIPGGTPAEVDE
jgi:hypothetical protein